MGKEFPDWPANPPFVVSNIWCVDAFKVSDDEISMWFFFHENTLHCHEDTSNPPWWVMVCTHRVLTRANTFCLLHKHFTPPNTRNLENRKDWAGIPSELQKQAMCDIGSCCRSETIVEGKLVEMLKGWPLVGNQTLGHTILCSNFCKTRTCWNWIVFGRDCFAYFVSAVVIVAVETCHAQWLQVVTNRQLLE